MRMRKRSRERERERRRKRQRQRSREGERQRSASASESASASASACGPARGPTRWGAGRGERLRLAAAQRAHVLAPPRALPGSSSSLDGAGCGPPRGRGARARERRSRRREPSHRQTWKRPAGVPPLGVVVSWLITRRTSVSSAPPRPVRPASYQSTASSSSAWSAMSTVELSRGARGGSTRRRTRNHLRVTASDLVQPPLALLGPRPLPVRLGREAVQELGREQLRSSSGSAIASSRSFLVVPGHRAIVGWRQSSPVGASGGRGDRPSCFAGAFVVRRG